MKRKYKTRRAVLVIVMDRVPLSNLQSCVLRKYDQFAIPIELRIKVLYAYNYSSEWCYLTYPLTE